MKLSPKQRQIAAYGGSEHRWTLVSGPMGSGKTHPSALGLVLDMSKYGGTEFCIVNKSWGQLRSFIEGELQRLVPETIVVQDDGSFELGGSYNVPNRVRCFSAQDKRIEPRLRSYNFAGGFVDEMTTLPSGVLAAVNARCRVGDARILGCTNPDGPMHPVKLAYFDNAEAIDAQVITTTLYDNPSLRPSYISSLEAHYEGHMRERMVYGRWAAASGLVFPRAIEFSHYDEPDEDIVAYDVAIDVGEASVTCALLLGRTATGRTWVLGEWAYHHAVQGPISEEQSVARLRQAFSGYDITAWIVDPAAKRYRNELQRQLGRGVRVGKAENDWTEGVEEVNHWFASDALFILGKRCPELMATIGALSYDEERALIGDDVPVKVADHLTDCLRYYVLTRAVAESGGRKVWQIQRDRRKEAT